MEGVSLAFESGLAPWVSLANKMLQKRQCANSGCRSREACKLELSLLEGPGLPLEQAYVSLLEMSTSCWRPVLSTETIDSSQPHVDLPPNCSYLSELSWGQANSPGQQTHSMDQLTDRWEIINSCCFKTLFWGWWWLCIIMLIGNRYASIMIISILVTGK